MNKKLKLVMVFSGVVWLVTNFHHPVTPSHFTNLGLPNHIFGTSYAMMVFASFLTAPIWGSWGDRQSRRMVLSLSFFLYGLAQIGFSMSSSMLAILFFRAMAGVANGGFSGGLMAAIVDTTSDENRELFMSKYTSLMLIATSVGYLVGGLLGFFTTRGIILFQGIAMLFVSLGFWAIVGETNTNRRLDRDKKVVFIWDILKDSKRSKEIFNSWIIIFLGLTFFIYIAKSSYLNGFNYYLKEQLDLKPIVNGVWKMVTGVVGFIANMTINVWIINKKDIRKSLVGLLGISVVSGLMIILDSSFYVFLIWNLVFFTVITILIPILQNFAVEGHTTDVGFMSGIYNAVRALGEVVGSMVAGFAYSLSSMAPFILSAAALFVATILSLRGLKIKEKV